MCISPIASVICVLIQLCVSSHVLILLLLYLDSSVEDVRQLQQQDREKLRLLVYPDLPVMTVDSSCRCLRLARKCGFKFLGLISNSTSHRSEQVP